VDRIEVGRLSGRDGSVGFASHRAWLTRTTLAAESSDLKNIGSESTGAVQIPRFFGQYFDIAAAEQTTSALGRVNFRRETSRPTDS
jgi:hypothetical protein